MLWPTKFPATPWFDAIVQRRRKNERESDAVSNSRIAALSHNRRHARARVCHPDDVNDEGSVKEVAGPHIFLNLYLISDVNTPNHVFILSTWEPFQLDVETTKFRFKRSSCIGPCNGSGVSDDADALIICAMSGTTGWDRSDLWTKDFHPPFVWSAFWRNFRSVS